MVDTAYLGNIGNGVDPNDPYATERERLMRFYSEHDPANATALVNAELGRRKAEQMFADAKSKIPTVTETAPKSELGRRIQSLVNVGGLYSSTPEEQAKIRQGQILDRAKGQIQSSTLEAGAKNLTPEQYADQKAQNLSAYDFLTRVQQGRATPGGTGTAPTYSDSSPSTPPAQMDGEYGFSGPSGDILQKALDASRSPPARVPEMLTPMQGATDERVMQPAPVPTPVRDLVARAQAVAARQASQPQKAAAPAQGGNFFSNLFKSGPAVQSNSQALTRYDAPNSSEMGPGRGTVHVNWGDRDNAADFFRADKAMRDAQSAGQEVTGMKRGGTAQAPGKDAALHKALEIIHHMITRGR